MSESAEKTGNKRSNTGTADTPEQAPLPPLRLHHLLLWTTVTAVLLAYTRWLQVDNFLATTWFLGLSTLFLIAGSMAVACVGLGIAWQVEGRIFFGEPGHGMLLILSLSLAGYLVDTTLSGFFASPDPPGRFLRYLPLSLSVVLIFATDVWFALKFWESLAWRSFFLVDVLNCGLQFVWLSLSNLLPHAWYTAIGGDDLTTWTLQGQYALVIPHLACLLWGVATDWRSDRPRHWTHWCGVGAWGALSAAMVVVIVLWFFDYFA